MSDVLLKGLKRLEYRGYDSSGVAMFHGGKIEVHKAAGKITEIEPLLADRKQKGLEGGIGHTRWATHGAPNTKNAHPHKVGDIVLVHNGIIENYREIQKLVHSKGLTPKSETDSELFAFLVHFEMTEEKCSFVEAVRKSFLKITGASSVVAMHEQHPGLIVGVRNGSPLVAAWNPELGAMLASDAQPLLDYANTVHYLENGDMIVCERNKIEFIDAHSGLKISRPGVKIDWSADRLDKNGYPHYMLKEIHEQSRTILDTLNANFAASGAHLPFDFAPHPGIDNLSRTDRLSIVACGTSWHASLLGKYWLEKFAGLSVEAELASEFRYRSPVLKKNQVLMGVSQSGETADTLAVIQDVNKREIPTMCITNVKGSTIARESKSALYTYAGPEIGVASTKAFTGQMLMLLLLAGKLGRDVAVNDSTGKAMGEIERTYRELFEVPHHLSNALMEGSPTAKAVKAAALATQNSKGFFFIGRGYSFPIALEGALKLKEIAYVHAEGYAAGELKHGPIAMLEPDFTVIVLAPHDMWYEKTVSNLQEVKARGARIIAIGHADDKQIPQMCDHFIPMPIKTKKDDGTPTMSEALNPFLLAPILQLFSYEIATMKGTDVDQPRNLAKSVTVE
ncbi:MAG: glutamine--fructose-6-phosphate transaminase (isomerizing) [Deltaproteobacteria bacterium]|nr:glutamine--fructose-6-phosphate transaminase (isomerizing) [Deltaproteobacteria bacterium]